MWPDLLLVYCSLTDTLSLLKSIYKKQLTKCYRDKDKLDKSYAFRRITRRLQKHFCRTVLYTHLIVVPGYISDSGCQYCFDKYGNSCPILIWIIHWNKRHISRNMSMHWNLRVENYQRCGKGMGATVPYSAARVQKKTAVNSVTNVKPTNLYVLNTSFYVELFISFSL